MNERRNEKNRSHPFKLPSQESPFVPYNFLDALFKVMNQARLSSAPDAEQSGNHEGGVPQLEVLLCQYQRLPPAS